MNEQERRWLEQHGGIVRTEGPDTNGVTVYHAADGSFVNIGSDGNPRMRGHRAPEQGGAPSTETPAPAAASPSGGGMNQQQIEQWIAANGGSGSVQYNSASRRIKNPARTMTNADGTDNPNYDPTAPEWVDVNEESWTNSKTGATLRVSRRPDGSTFDVLDNKSADPNKTGGNQDTPATRQAAEEEREKQWNRDNGGLYETHAARREREAKEKAATDRTGKPTGNTRQTSKNGTTVKETEYQLPDGTKEWRSQTETGEPDRVGKPSGNTRQRTENGQSIKEVEYVLPDGSKEWRAQTAPADRKGGKLPPGVNPPRFSRGNVAAELNRFNRELDAAVSRGEITKEEATGFYTPYHQEAQTYLSEQNYGDSQDQNAVSAGLTQRGQNLSTASNRATWANSAFQNAAAQDNNLLMGAAGTGKSALVPLLTLQAGLTNAAGGFRDQPEIEVRRYPSVRANVPASIKPAIDAAAVAPSGVAAGTKPAPLIAPAPPASAEAARQQQAAGGGATAPSPVLAPPAAPAATAASAPPQRDSKPMIRVDLGDEYVYYDPTPELTVAAQSTPGSALVDAPRDRQNAYREPKTANPPTNMKPDAGVPGNPDYQPGLPPGTSIVPPPPPQIQSGPDPSLAVPPITPPVAPMNTSDQPHFDPSLPRGQMMPRSIQAAMPQQQGPDVDGIVERMLADGVPYEDAMEIRRRYRGGVAA